MPLNGSKKKNRQMPKEEKKKIEKNEDDLKKKEVEEKKEEEEPKCTLDPGFLASLRELKKTGARQHDHQFLTETDKLLPPPPPLPPRLNPEWTGVNESIDGILKKPPPFQVSTARLPPMRGDLSAAPTDDSLEFSAEDFEDRNNSVKRILNESHEVLMKSPENKQTCGKIDFSPLDNVAVSNGVLIIEMISNDERKYNEDNPQVVLRYGTIREVITLQRNNEMLDRLMEKARQLVEKRDSLNTKDIFLFRHDYNASTILHPITSANDIKHTYTIEIVLVDRIETAAIPHVVEPESFMQPTFCDFCGERLTGFLQLHFASKCKLCGGNFHKGCWEDVRNNCMQAASAQIASSSTYQSSSSFATPATPTAPQTPTFPVAALPTPSGLPHTLVEHSYRQLPVCKVCNSLLVGLVKQGLKCRDCSINVHRKCEVALDSNCVLSENAISRVNFNEPEQSNPNDNIPLFRLPGQVGTRGTEKKNLEGWMMHFILSDPERRLKHYWMMVNNSIQMYNEYTEGIGVNPNKVYRVIPLAEIVSVVMNNGKSVLAKHVFEIHTNDTVYCIGEDYHAFSGGPPKKKSNTTMWFQFIKESLQSPSQTEDNTEQALEFANLYQVSRYKSLGSGQFGTVYSAIQRHSGKEVAVKVIAKERFSKKGSGAESMRAEVAILQQTCHPGIVRLEFMCETKDKIFVVMEKMNGDMLEMILSQELGRLNSRVTKFLLFQILCALKYLHDQGIAHCDLKPENVLLSDMRSNFPQTKICDFGYARFIPESQFRKTVVGTPAYLPPEVLQRKGYNKSLDMWSVGVIIYVTLSGTFPFNEGEEIAEQIQNATFMFPDEVEALAVDLIQKLLKVEIEARMSIEKCLDHGWLKGEQLFKDLRDLEIRLNEPRYLTTKKRRRQLQSTAY